MQLTIVHVGGGTEGGHPKLNEFLLTHNSFHPFFLPKGGFIHDSKT
jgi:hypothetical protein